MRYVAYLVAIAESDDLGEVVLDDTEMIAVVLDVRRQQQRVAPAEDQLLAVIWRAPVDFERNLVCLHHLGRIGEAFTNLRQKGEPSQGGRRVVRQSGIRQLPRATLGCASHQYGHAGVVPVLRGRRSGHGGHRHHGDDGGQGRAESRHASEVSEHSTRENKIRDGRSEITFQPDCHWMLS